MKGSHITLVLLTILLHSAASETNCGTDSDCISAQQFEMNTEVSGNEVVVTWTFNESIGIYGFKSMIYSTDRDIVYESPMLHYSQRSMSISHEIDGENRLCVYVYENSTHVLSEKCEKVKTADYKVIIGILAGTIFLIPCLVGLSYVIYQDHKRSNEPSYTYLDSEKGHKKLNPATVTTSKKGDEIVLKVTLVESERHDFHGTANVATHGTANDDTCGTAIVATRGTAIDDTCGTVNAAYKHDDIEQLKQQLTNGTFEIATEADEESRQSHATTHIENENDKQENGAKERDTEEESLKKPTAESSHL